ncbi:MAG: PAS domain-containing protein, partial [Verrucomicrobiales bacterium]
QRIMLTGKPIIGQVEKKMLLDGRTGWALVSKIPLKDAAGRVFGTCGISKDITALKNAEDALQEANTQLARQKSQLEQALAELQAAQQKLIELANITWVARLAFCVAHEVRNPLNILGMGLGYLANEASVTENPANKEILAEMQEALRRSDSVIAALMEGAAANNPTFESSEVAATLDLALSMLKGKAAGDGLPSSME